MQADALQLSAAVGSGPNVAVLTDTNSDDWGLAACAYATTPSPGANVLQAVTPSNGMPVQPATGSTWAITATSLPLPIGASTAAAQATGNTSLAAIAAAIVTCDTGHVTISGALPGGTNKIGGVTIADGDAATIGSKADAAVTNPASAGSVIALLKGLLTELEGTLNVGGTIAVSNFPATQTVAGTVTANIGTSGSLALEAGGNLAAAKSDLDTLAGAVSSSKFQCTVATALPAGTALLGKVGIDQTTPGTTNGIVNVPVASGGLTPYSYIAAGSTNQDSQVVKASAGQIYGYALSNTTASVRYVKVYDKATAPTSSDTPKMRLMLPASGGRERTYAGLGLAFANGLGIRITTGPGDSDTGACSTNDVLVNIDYN